MALKDIWAKERAQRLTEIAERKLEVAQHRQQTQAELRAIRQELDEEAQVLHTMLQEFATNLHETGVKEKRQRQLEIAKRKQEVLELLEQFSSERALMSQEMTEKLQRFRTNLHNYVWGH